MATPIHAQELNKVVNKKLNRKADKAIRNYTIAATGSGIIPIPVVSATAITGIQVMLIKELCRLYNIPFTKKRMNVIINSVIGSMVTRLLALATVAIPGVSAPMKGLSGGAIAGIYTATVGEFYKVHFQNGGTLKDASIGDLSKYFLEEYQRGDISLSSITNPTNMMKRMIG